MANAKRSLKVFLCHAKADKERVRELYSLLQKRRIKPWLDEVDLVGGQDWQAEIPKALATSDAIIICLSKNSVDKQGYIQKEIRFALDKALEMPEGRIFIIPVRFEDCEVPPSLARYQWVDLFDEAGYAKLMKALKFQASQLERTSIKLPGAEENDEPRIGNSYSETHAREKTRANLSSPQRVASLTRSYWIGAVVVIGLLALLLAWWGTPKLLGILSLVKYGSNQANVPGGLDQVEKATIKIEAQGTFVDAQVGQQTTTTGKGSGFIIDPSGIAVTNNSVVAGAALINVWLEGESDPREAKVLGQSECSDLAVLQIEGEGPYTALDWYQGEVKPGLEVYAAGFPLGEPEYNLTKGIISKLNARGDTAWASLKSVLGHDATINQGNSGGPLVTGNGEVVGVNFRGRPDTNQYFAISADIALPIIEELKAGKDLDTIGINGTAIIAEDKSLSGIWVSSVKSGSLADKAGIQPGDIIYQMEGLVLATDGTMKDYCDVIRSHSATDTIAVTVVRYNTGELLEGQLNGQELEVTGHF